MGERTDDENWKDDDCGHDSENREHNRWMPIEVRRPFKRIRRPPHREQDRQRERRDQENQKPRNHFTLLPDASNIAPRPAPATSQSTCPHFGLKQLGFS